MSTISSSTTNTTAYKVTADTTGTLVFQTGATPTTALTIDASQAVTFAGTTKFAGSTSGTTTLQATAVAGTTTLTLPAATDTLVGKATTDTLTNKTLVAPALGTPASGNLSNCTGIPSPSAATATALGTVYGSTPASVNVSLGYNSGTGGSYNNFVGNTAGQNITGSYNDAYGQSAFTGASPFTANRNCAFGYASFTSATSGAHNAYFGFLSGAATTSGNNNVGSGSGALQSNNTASKNTAIGVFAGYALTTGGNNVCLGMNAGYGAPVGNPNLTTGANGVYIGGYASPSASGNTYEIVIGYNTLGKGTGTGFISPGGGGVYQGNNSSTWSTTSDQRLKKNIVDNNIGLEKIAAIQVRNFEYRLPEEVDAELKPTDAIQKSGVQLGVIAQELNEVLPDCVKTETTGVMSVNADNLTWYMVNAIKELKAEIDSLKAQINGASA